MISVRRLFLPIIISISVIFSASHASELIVENDLVEIPENPSEPALISVSLMNNTGGSIKNVDLRLSTGAVTLGNGILQMGNIANEDTSISMVDVITTPGDGNFPGTLTWQLDYDLSDGTHHQYQITVPVRTQEAGQ